jgi:hypothetical protein
MKTTPFTQECLFFLLGEGNIFFIFSITPTQSENTNTHLSLSSVQQYLHYQIKVYFHRSGDSL